MVETLSEHLIVFPTKEKRYFFGLGTSTVQNTVTVVLLRISSNTFITRTARLQTLLHFFSTYWVSKSGPYRVIRLSGQYVEI